MYIKKFIILCSLFFMKVFANEFSINHLENTEWRGTYCSSYGDGIFQGTYNYHFKENNQIESYIEYFTDLSCKTKIDQRVDIQTQGKYKIKNSYTQNDWSVYDLEVKLNHLSYPLFFKLKINKNNMMICYSSARCNSYVKILN